MYDFWGTMESKKISGLYFTGEVLDLDAVTGGYNSVNVSDSTGVTILVAVATDYDPTQFELNADGTVNMSKTPYKNTQGVKAAVEKAEKRIIFTVHLKQRQTIYFRRIDT